MIRREWIAAAAVALLAARIHAAPLPANLRNDIDNANREWLEGLKTGDAARAAAGFAGDAVNCNAAGDCVRGIDALRAGYADLIARFGNATGGVVRSETLHVDHDLAFETGYAEALFANANARKGRFATVWKLQKDGHWKIIRNLALPPAPQ